MTLEVAHWGGRWGAAPVVAATSAVNAIAFSAHQTWAFRRAEVTNFVEAPFLCQNGFRATMALVRTLPPRAIGAERMALITAQALDSVADAVKALSAVKEVPVVLSLPDRLAGDEAGRAPQRRTIERAVAASFARVGRSAQITHHARGHASFGFALREAIDLLVTRRLEAVVVGGVDSYYDPDVVDTLLQEGRLFDGEELDSFIPGEGAAFLVLSRPHVARRLSGPLARVESVATNDEPAHWGTGLPSMGLGLSRAMRSISDRIAAERRFVDLWLADVTNENHRVHEWQLAYPRASAGVSREGTEFQFLPPLLGDLGAATMATAAVIAIEGLRRSDPEADTCLIMGSSQGPERAAVLLAREPTEGG